MAHLDDPEAMPPPTGYTAPFYKADRENEYRQAHAVFSAAAGRRRRGLGAVVMRPTLAAESAAAEPDAVPDDDVRGRRRACATALAAFLTHPEQGIFRGPYLRIRTPFRPADDGWRRHLEWAPAGFTPYGHQAKAFERLSTLHGPAEPTLVTTGTGSGKTESFLFPILDHCRRERAAGRAGVKAVLLYPMNALATDQAQRHQRAAAREPELARGHGRALHRRRGGQRPTSGC